jgi:hypothetical protein
MFASKFSRALAATVAGGSLAVILAAGATAGVASSASAATSPAPAAGVAPAAAVIGSDRLLGYTGTDGSFWLRNLSTGGLTGAAGHLIGAPALLADGNTLFVFGRGTDNQLWVNICTWSGSCGTWVSLGGTLTSAPAASISGPSVADYSVYARGTNGALWSRTRTASGWGGWRSLGGQLLNGTGPAAAYLTGDGPYTLVVGTNQQLYVEGPGMTGFNPAGGRTTSTPALTAIPSAQNQPAALIGFARGTDNAGYYHRFIASTPGWHSMGGQLSSGVAAAMGVEATIPGTYTYALGADDSIQEAVASWAAPAPGLNGWHPVG